MIVQIIFSVSMYPVLFVLYFMMRGVGDAKNGYSFGLRMKAEWMTDLQVQEIVKQYQKELKQQTIVLALIPLLTFFIPYMSVAFTVWMLWMMAVITLPVIPYIRGHKKIKALKMERGWKKQGGERTLTEIKSAGKVRRVKLLTFLPPMLISAAAALWSVMRFGGEELGGLAFMVVTFALLTPLFYGVAVWMDAQKIEVISEDSDVNLNYARAKKNIWKNLWLLVAWVNTVFTVFSAASLYLDELETGLMLTGTVVYTIVVLGLMLWTWKKTLAVDARYREAWDLSDEDDDDLWLWGACYYNKNDKHVMVNRRVGIGTTMNLATPVGMGTTIFGIALLLVIVPVSCIWLMLEEFTPIQLAVEQNVLVAEHLRTEYEIPLSDIESVELLSEKPTWSKVSGTGMENLCKGTFHIRNVGKCEALLNPQNAVFLRIETADHTYYMSDVADNGTEAVYRVLLDAAEVQ